VVDYELRAAARPTKAGEGLELPVLSRAAAALAAWIAAAGRAGAGLSDRSVAEIVKARAELAGYDPREFGGHGCARGSSPRPAARARFSLKSKEGRHGPRCPTPRSTTTFGYTSTR
jgi:hypothetical protein